MVVGVLWWTAWRVVPRWFRYKFIGRKEKLQDGTVVTLVRGPLAIVGITANAERFVVLTEEKGVKGQGRRVMTLRIRPLKLLYLHHRYSSGAVRDPRRRD